MEQMIKTPKKQYKYNRIYLNDEASSKLSLLSRQVNEHFSGMIKVNKSDLANLIICEHKEEFSKRELNYLQSSLLTDLQRAKWIVLQLEKAKKEGRETNFDSLVNKAQNKKQKRRRSKDNLATPEKE